MRLLQSLNRFAGIERSWRSMLAEKECYRGKGKVAWFLKVNLSVVRLAALISCGSLVLMKLYAACHNVIRGVPMAHEYDLHILGRILLPFLEDLWVFALFALLRFALGILTQNERARFWLAAMSAVGYQAIYNHLWIQNVHGSLTNAIILDAVLYHMCLAVIFTVRLCVLWRTKNLMVSVIAHLFHNMESASINEFVLATYGPSNVGPAGSIVAIVGTAVLLYWTLNKIEARARQHVVEVLSEGIDASATQELRLRDVATAIPTCAVDQAVHTVPSAAALPSVAEPSSRKREAPKSSQPLERFFAISRSWKDLTRPKRGRREVQWSFGLSQSIWRVSIFLTCMTALVGHRLFWYLEWLLPLQMPVGKGWWEGPVFLYNIAIEQVVLVGTFLLLRWLWLRLSTSRERLANWMSLIPVAGAYGWLHYGHRLFMVHADESVVWGWCYVLFVTVFAAARLYVMSRTRNLTLPLVWHLAQVFFEFFILNKSIYQGILTNVHQRALMTPAFILATIVIYVLVNVSFLLPRKLTNEERARYLDRAGGRSGSERDGTGS